MAERSEGYMAGRSERYMVDRSKGYMADRYEGYTEYADMSEGVVCCNISVWYHIT